MCGKAFTADVFLIIEIIERPNLLEKICREHITKSYTRTVGNSRDEWLKDVHPGFKAGC
jgi:hypothetical protein